MTDRRYEPPRSRWSLDEPVDAAQARPLGPDGRRQRSRRVRTTRRFRVRIRHRSRHGVVLLGTTRGVARGPVRHLAVAHRAVRLLARRRRGVSAVLSRTDDLGSHRPRRRRRRGRNGRQDAVGRGSSHQLAASPRFARWSSRRDVHRIRPRGVDRVARSRRSVGRGSRRRRPRRARTPRVDLLHRVDRGGRCAP